MAPKAKKEVVTIKPIVDKVVTVRLIGDTPLIMHKWTEKMKRALPAGTDPDEANDITVKKEYPGKMESFITSMYWITEMPKEYTEEAFIKAIQEGARFGFRVESFKLAAIDAAYSKGWIPNKKGIKGLFFIEPDYVDEEGNQLVEIKRVDNEPPALREDVVILSGISRKPDLRWRGQFTHWYVDLRIRYDQDGQYSLQDIVNMLQAGGRYNGIGEYRPEKDGQFGMFHVDA